MPIVDIPIEDSSQDDSSTTTDDINDTDQNPESNHTAQATEATSTVRIISAPMWSKDYVCKSTTVNPIPDWKERVSVLERMLLIGGLNDVEQKRLVVALLQLVTGGNSGSVTL